MCYNETAAAQCPWQGDRVGSGKNAVEQPGKGKGSLSMIVACTCTHTCNIRIKMASAPLYYTGCMSRMSLYHSVLPKGRSTFPSALAPSALVPNAIIVARLNLLSHSKMQPL